MFRKMKLFLMKFVISICGDKYHWVSDERLNTILYRLAFGTNPNIDNPVTFNEHIIHRKVRYDEHWLSEYTDKYRVRDFVKERLGAAYLNDLLGVYRHFDDIDVQDLPNKFVLKTNHGSGWNIVVTDKEKFDIVQARKKMNKWLSRNYYGVSREKNYQNIVPCILCERYIEGIDKLIEYKAFCFHGKMKFVTCNWRAGNKRISNYYNETWEYLDVGSGYAQSDEMCLSKSHTAVIEVAEKLAQGFDFVRVDLYDIDGALLFSELTFHPGGGFTPFAPREYDMIFGGFFVHDE